MVTQRHRFPSPLRYPGGKGKLANYIKLLFIENGIIGHTYIEPYAGGAAAALSLLYEEYADHIIINDIDRGIVAFWTVLTQASEEFCARILTTDVTVAEWRTQKAIQSEQDPDEFDLAFSTFFLNRTNRSGIISGGPIGGKHQSGKWKLDARYNKDDLIFRIRKVARYRSRITVSAHDALVLLTGNLLPDQRAFLYLDPPYFAKGPGLYTNHYTTQDHRRIAEALGDSALPWIVTYDNVPEILDAYSGHPRIEYSLNYSVADRYLGKEVLFLGPGVAPVVGARPGSVSQDAVDRAKIG